ncbi:MAG: septum formation initiator family protein [Negativicutes bacterium]|jgi:cell division protein FtsL
MLKEKSDRVALKRRTRRKGLRDIICLALLVVLVFFLVIFGKQQYDMSVIRAEKEQLHQKIEALKIEQRRAMEEKKKLDDSQYIEKMAREQGLAKPGEIPYISNETTPVGPDKQKKNE